ncbi:MAG: hypothetical protein Tsb0027_13170 [Wenzhouxiangellaceae bacterium]
MVAEAAVVEKELEKHSVFDDTINVKSTKSGTQYVEIEDTIFTKDVLDSLRQKVIRNLLQEIIDKNQ